MRNLPFRPDNTISQTFNSGVCTLYRQRDTARPGYKPRPELERKAFLRYEELRMGLNRYYVARQADVEVERVIRVPRGSAGSMPNPQDVIRTEDGTHYRIDFVQRVPGVWPESLDLTLVRYMWDGDNPQSAAAPLPAPLPKEPLPPAGGTKGAQTNEMV